jgi:hypothetical protein
MPSKYSKNSRGSKLHLLRAKGIGSEITNLRDDLQSEISGGLWSTQTAWAVDPVLGSDTNIGTPALPLKTMDEFNNRFIYLPYKVAGSLQLVGDVLDAPLMLQGTRFNLGASLSVSGTFTTTATGLIATVTPLGPSSTGPWQVDTTGITWTAGMVTQQARLSTGHTCMVLEVIDADTVILGGLGTTASIVTSTAPTPASTITVGTISRSMPPVIMAMGQQLQATPQLTLQSLAFELGSASNGYAFSGGIGTLLFGCEIKQVNEFRAESPVTLRCCGYSITATFSNNPARLLTTQGCVVRGTGSTLFNQQTGQTSHSNLSLTGARFSVNSSVSTIAGVYSQKTAGPVLINGANSYVSCTGSTSALYGSTGNTGIAIDIPSGKMGYFAASKPTITAGSDPRVGGITKTLAQIPFVAFDATVPAAFTGNGAAFIQE